jgi:CheY-like chemotaxis protein
MEKDVVTPDPAPVKDEGGKSEEQKKEAPGPAKQAGELPPRKTILVVDDVQVMRLRLRAQLEESGFNVLDAESGDKALALLEKHQDIKIVLTDVNMAGMDGVELTRRIRTSPKFASLPVVFCTAKGEFSIVRQAKQLGVRGFLVKPVTKLALLATINRELA